MSTAASCKCLLAMVGGPSGLLVMGQQSFTYGDSIPNILAHQAQDGWRLGVQVGFIRPHKQTVTDTLQPENLQLLIS